MRNPATIPSGIRQQNAKLKEITTLLLTLVNTGSNDNDIYCQMRDIEEASFKLTRENSRQMLLTKSDPGDREDFQEINLAQEELITEVTALAARLTYFKFTTMSSTAHNLVKILNDMVATTGQMLSNIKMKKEVEKHAGNIRTLREEYETVILLGVGELYEEKPTVEKNVLNVVKWTMIYDRIEAVIKRTVKLSHIIEEYVIKKQ